MKNLKEMLNRDVEKKGPFCILEIVGGLGKNILATAVISAIKKKYPDHKIIVVSAWEAPLFYNSEVERVYTFGQTPYFYSDYIFEDTKIFKIDPYSTEDHILKRKHLIKTWLDLYNIPYDGEMPKIYLNPREIELVTDKIKPNSGKPLLLMHTHGGVVGSQYSKKSWARDIPIEIAQKLVNYFSKSYRILHLRLPDQPELQNVEMLDLPQRELFVVITLAKKRILIDSFVQHAAAAFNLPSTVCWIANDPKVWGYEMHDNIEPNQEKKYEFKKYAYLEEYELSGQIQEFPYNTVNCLDINKIMFTFVL